MLENKMGKTEERGGRGKEKAHIHTRQQVTPQIHSLQALTMLSVRRRQMQSEMIA